MSTIGSRLKDARKRCNLTLKDVKEMTGISTGNLSELENDVKQPSSQTLVLLKQVYGISIDWVLTGEISSHNEKLLDDEYVNIIRELVKENQQEELKILLEFLNFRYEKSRIKCKSTYSTQLDDDPPTAATKEEPTIYLPILGDAAAGIPIEIIEMRQGEVLVNEKHSKYNSFVIRAKGNSMINAGIDNGDLVVIRPQPVVENGEIALININGEATIKYFYLHNGKCELKSANPSYSPMVFTCDNISILGKVVEVIKHK